jgi:hypothetical protein
MQFSFWVAKPGFCRGKLGFFLTSHPVVFTRYDLYLRGTTS